MKKYYFAGAQRIAMRTGSTVSYLLTDHLGSTSITTNSAGALVSELRYKPWGEVRYSNGTTSTRYTYTGQYSNVSDFGLMYYNARWYDPALSRFTQADSIVPGGVQGLDRYAYVSNNPVKYTDPSGHVNQAQCNYLKNYNCEMSTATRSRTGFANNLSEMLNLAYLQYDVIYLTGDALEKIKADSKFQKFRSDLLYRIITSNEFMNEPIVFHYSKHVVFGGDRDPTPMWMQLIDSENPEYAETWAVAKNELTWMLREASVTANTEVTKEGQMTISYEVYDVFDLKPAGGRTLEYNVLSATLGEVWHGQMRASAPEVYARWTEIMAFSVNLSNISSER